MVNAVAEGLVTVGTVSVPVSVGDVDRTVLPVPVLVVVPVPPRFTATVAPFQVALVIDPVQSSVLVDQLTFEGVCACVSQVPAAGELTNNVKSMKAPDCNVARVVPVLF